MFEHSEEEEHINVSILQTEEWVPSKMKLFIKLFSRQPQELELKLLKANRYFILHLSIFLHKTSIVQKKIVLGQKNEFRENTIKRDIVYSVT